MPRLSNDYEMDSNLLNIGPTEFWKNNIQPKIEELQPIMIDVDLEFYRTLDKITNISPGLLLDKDYDALVDVLQPFMDTIGSSSYLESPHVQKVLEMTKKVIKDLSEDLNNFVMVLNMADRKKKDKTVVVPGRLMYQQESKQNKPYDEAERTMKPDMKRYHN